MNANGRRARQARQNYNHISGLGKPVYKKRSLDAQVAHEARVRAEIKRRSAQPR